MRPEFFPPINSAILVPETPAERTVLRMLIELATRDHDCLQTLALENADAGGWYPARSCGGFSVAMGWIGSAAVVGGANGLVWVCGADGGKTELRMHIQSDRWERLTE